jgi:hypothetical protein
VKKDWGDSWGINSKIYSGLSDRDKRLLMSGVKREVRVF